MATRSHLGYVNKNGTMKAVYCHYDGYPEFMIPALESFIEERGIETFVSEIHRATQESGIRMIKPKNGMTVIETFGEIEGRQYNGEDFSVTSRKGLREEYAYLLHRDSGEIVEFFIDGKSMRSPIHFGKAMGRFIFDQEEKAVKFNAFSTLGSPPDCDICGFLIEKRSILQKGENICTDCAKEKCK